MDLELEVSILRENVEDIYQKIAFLPLVIGDAGGGGFYIREYDDFPAIPSLPTIISCKGQAWYAEDGYTYWHPMNKLTDEDGEPA